MSLTARRFTEKPSQRIAVPKLSKVTREEAERLPLLERMLLQEHQRHAYRLADIRRVADKLAALAPVIRAAQADGASIDIERVREGFASHRCGSGGRRVNAVVLASQDTLSTWRNPKAINAVAKALIKDGWRVVRADAEGSELSLDRVIFMHGSRAVQTSCTRQWTVEAIEAGHINAATDGRHPAADTGKPLNASAEALARTACAP